MVLRVQCMHESERMIMIPNFMWISFLGMLNQIFVPNLFGGHFFLARFPFPKRVCYNYLSVCLSLYCGTYKQLMSKNVWAHFLHFYCFVFDYDWIISQWCRYIVCFLKCWVPSVLCCCPVWQQALISEIFSNRLFMFAN